LRHHFFGKEVWINRGPQERVVLQNTSISLGDCVVQGVFRPQKGPITRIGCFQLNPQAQDILAVGIDPWDTLKPGFDLVMPLKQRVV
jgi:hypothetical protein